ncbi:MAG: 6-phosphogluconolactonase [Sulfuritalea sp.]|nr:6-phosphogluconolactonase [Sulfuritalea sp.]
MRPIVCTFGAKEWPVLAATLLQDNIDGVLRAQGRCSVMLTGGYTAARLYSAWADLNAFQRLTDVRYYFSDERCVSPNNAASNYGMALQILFQGSVPAGCSIFRMEADDVDCVAAAGRYGEVLPDQVDVLLLGVGEDGHIASLFPRGEALRESGRLVVPTIGPNPPYHRLTVTPPVIANAKSVLLLATGKAKGNMLALALTSTEDFMSLPVRLSCGGTWLLDKEAAEQVVTKI